MRLTPTALSEWMRRFGSLPHGRVEDLRVAPEHETFVSKLAFVEATYSADAPPELPRRLLVKSALRPPTTTRDGMGELEFYRRLAPVAGTPPIVRCVAAIDEHEGDQEILVLEDIRATHDHPPWPVVPSLQQCVMAIDTLTHIHAHWWEAPTLGRSVGQPHTSESLRTMVHGIAARLPEFFAVVGDALSTDARHVLDRVFNSSLQPWLRLTDPRSLTLAHGDAHTWNFMFPRSGGGATFLIDWQLWHVDVGARDLAFCMALHWDPSLRREREEPLLRHYHDRLLARGVDGYSFSELMLDYRRCVVRNLTMPILFWSQGMKRARWWYRLENALAAYSDLSCEDLL